MTVVEQIVDFFVRLVKGRIDGAEIAARSKAKGVEYKAKSRAAKAFNDAVDGGIDKARGAGKPKSDPKKPEPTSDQES